MRGYDDPNWPRASAWIEGDCFPNPDRTIGILGVPLNWSITPGRCDQGPSAIREALFRFSTYDMTDDVDLRRIRATDMGDLSVAGLETLNAAAPIARGVDDALRSCQALVILGGDNGLTRPAALGLRMDPERLGILTLDAHFDLRDLEPQYNNGNPIRALIQDGVPGLNIVQIGLLPFSNSPAYAKIALEAGIEYYTADKARAIGVATLVKRELDRLAARCDAIYVDIDMDVLDRSFSPGTPGSRPGGLFPYELRSAARICGRHQKVVAIDFVEFDPTCDACDVTSLSAASCVLEFAAGFAQRTLVG